LITLARRKPFRLGLLGDRPYHRFVDIDILDLDPGDLDAQTSVCLSRIS